MSSKSRPADSSPKPGGSNSAVRDAALGSCQAASGSATAPMNRFTRKTQRQPSPAPAAAMIRPPSTGPSAVDTPIVAPSMPNAFDRCGPLNDSWIVAAIAG